MNLIRFIQNPSEEIIRQFLIEKITRGSMNIREEAKFIHDKWCSGNQDGALESLEEFEGRLKLAVLVQLVLIMLDQPESGDLPELVKMLED